MVSRVIVTIDGSQYTVVSEESEEHVRTCAALVDRNIKDIKASTPFSSMTATVLAAMNMAGKYYKAQESADHLRNQVRDYAAENSRLQNEINRLQKGK